MAQYKPFLTIGLDLEYGGGDFEYRREDLEKLEIKELRYIQDSLIYFIGETERIIKLKLLEAMQNPAGV